MKMDVAIWRRGETHLEPIRKFFVGVSLRGGGAAEAVSRPVKGGLLRPYGARNDTTTIFFG